jgi:hypothetical protein
VLISRGVFEFGSDGVDERIEIVKPVGTNAVTALFPVNPGGVIAEDIRSDEKFGSGADSVAAGNPIFDNSAGFVRSLPRAGSLGEGLREMIRVGGRLNIQLCHINIMRAVNKRVTGTIRMSVTLR